MTDIVDAATRSRMMSRIRGKDTAPEMLVRRFLHSKGFRYRLHVKELLGKPDIVLPKYRTVIFVHGCFWHQHPGCPDAVMPKSNSAFWKSKLESNTERDKRHISALSSAGWHSIIVWECEAKDQNHLSQIISNLYSNLKTKNPKKENLVSRKSNQDRSH